MTHIKNHPVLITGGAGYIGNHTLLELRARGWPLTVIDNLSTGRRNLVPDDVPFVEGDAGDIPLVREALRRYKCKAVIHFAGSIINPESFDVPLDYYANNTSASRNLLEACVAEGVENFIFSSSASVYGEAEFLPIPETAPLRPASPYGTSKLMTEWMLRDAADAHGLTYAALRYFNVAGADAEGRSGQVGPATHLIKIATETVVGSRDGMSIFGDDYDTPDGTCIRDYIHVSDLAEAHADTLEYLVAGGESSIINCGYGHGYSVKEVLDVVEEISGKSLGAAVTPRRRGDVAALVADNSKILKTLPWRPKRDDLHEIVRSAIAWEKLQKNTRAA
jgi:UDP-glucose 4-epimerase